MEIQGYHELMKSNLGLTMVTLASRFRVVRMSGNHCILALGILWGKMFLPMINSRKNLWK